MKKIKVLAFALAMMMAGSSMAQFVVGGQIGVNTTGGHHTYTWNDTEYTLPNDASCSLTLMPKVGYQFNDKMEAGLRFGFVRTSETEYTYGMDFDNAQNYWNKAIRNGWTIAPYFRYTFAQTGKLGFFAEAQLSLTGTGFGKAIAHTPTVETTAIGHQRSFVCDLSVVPGMSYKLNDHLSMDLYVDLLRLGVKSARTTYFDNDNAKVLARDVDNSFSFLANGAPATLDNQLSAFRLGFNILF